MENAFNHAKKAVTLNEQLPEALYNYAVLLETYGKETEAIKYYHKLLRICKFEDYVRRRVQFIDSGMFAPKDSLRGSSVTLKHPENIIKNTLVIVKTNKKMSSTDLASHFKVLNKKHNDNSKSPTRQKVRFLNVPSLTSEDVPKEEQKLSKPVVKEPPKNGLDILKQLRAKESTKGKFNLAYLFTLLLSKLR